MREASPDLSFVTIPGGGRGKQTEAGQHRGTHPVSLQGHSVVQGDSLTRLAVVRKVANHVRDLANPGGKRETNTSDS